MINQPPTAPLVVLSLMQRLVAINAHTGQRVWQHETGLPENGRLFVDGGLVIFSFGVDVRCLDYLTGALRWRAKLPVVNPLLLVFAGCIIATGLGEVACLNAQTGAQLWHDQLKGYGSGSGPLAAPGVATQVDHR